MVDKFVREDLDGNVLLKSSPIHNEHGNKERRPVSQDSTSSARQWASGAKINENQPSVLQRGICDYGTSEYHLIGLRERTEVRYKDVNSRKYAELKESIGGILLRNLKMRSTSRV